MAHLPKDIWCHPEGSGLKYWTCGLIHFFIFFLFYPQIYLDINKLKPWDFFKSMDKYGDMKIPVAEFRRAMMLVMFQNVEFF